MNNVCIETYGCQMNQADSGIVAKVLKDNGFNIVDNVQQADIILLNTCAVRDNAEQRIHNRLRDLQAIKKHNHNLKLGVIGCMAERLKDQLISQDKVDIVCGPDNYRLIAYMIQKDIHINVQLSDIETYEDIDAIQLNSDNLTAFVPIMRGCENFCSYCVVPYTRGKERSLNAKNIISQVEDLFSRGYRDITLLGQNVNSYRYQDGSQTIDFADLLAMVSRIDNKLRVRFATSHPKDLSEKLITTIASGDNICKYIHLPVQSGSDKVLKTMNRKYTVDQYLQKIDLIRKIIPNCGLSTDVIAGFCGESLQDHQMTLDLFQKVGYDSAFMFKYSNREGTLASKKLKDDVPEKEKVRRLEEIIALQRELSLQSNKKDIGQKYQILIEGLSKRDNNKMFGRTSQNKVVIVDKLDNKKGDYIDVIVQDCTSATLFGEKICKK